MRMRFLAVIPLTLAALVASAPPAVAADPTTMATAEEVSLPAYSGLDLFSSSLVPAPADDAGNAAVSTACNGGAEIYATRWWRVTTPEDVKVLISTSAWGTQWRQHWSVRDPELTSGLALLDAAGGVLECSIQKGLTQIGPTEVTAGTTFYAVQFLTAACPPEGCFSGSVVRFFSMVGVVPPSAPLNVEVGIVPRTALQHVVTWEQPFDHGGTSLTSYLVYRSVKYGPVELVAEVTADQTSWVDPDSITGHVAYAVAAKNQVGVGPMSTLEKRRGVV